jgi:hypothetical protein
MFSDAARRRVDKFVRNPVALAKVGSNHVILDIYGACADWSIDAWRFIGTWYYVDAELDPQISDEGLMTGYLQVERQLPQRLTAFARPRRLFGAHG